MAEKLEPFRKALATLRHRLLTGQLAPGARVTAKGVAEDLDLSATPVREALSRLAGEGLLTDHRGEGFFVPWLSAADVAALYKLSEQTLLIAQTSASRPRPAVEASEPDGLSTAAQTVERLFDRWASEADSLVATSIYRSVSARLAPARLHESQVIANPDEEATDLTRLASPAARPRRPAAIRAYHRRRMALSARLAAAIQMSSRRNRE